MTEANRIAGIEALRGLACMMVIISHVPAYVVLPPTLHELLAIPLFGTGVDLFFVISGFVTAQSYSRRQNCSFVKATLAFWRRRIIRLFPLLIIVVTITYLFDMVTLREAMISVAFLANIGQTFDLFEPHSVLSPLWSVATEMQFYLVVPFISCLPRRLLYVTTCAVLIVGIMWSRPWGDVAWFWRPEAFLLGHLLHLERHFFVASLQAKTSLATLSMPIIAIAVVGRILQGDGAGAYIVIVALISFTAVALSLNANPSSPLEWIGQRTYALYLIHVPVLVQSASYLPWYLALLVACLVLLTFAHILTVKIDQPLRRVLQKRK